MKAITLPQICKEKNSKLAGCIDLYIFVMLIRSLRFIIYMNHIHVQKCF